jgi:hypothetical protein
MWKCQSGVNARGTLDCDDAWAFRGKLDALFCTTNAKENRGRGASGTEIKIKSRIKIKSKKWEASGVVGELARWREKNVANKAQKKKTLEFTGFLYWELVCQVAQKELVRIRRSEDRRQSGGQTGE